MSELEKLLKELEKKRWTKFLVNLDVAKEKHLKGLLGMLNNIINKFCFINNKLYYLHYKKAQLIEQQKTDLKNTLKFELGFLANFVDYSLFYTFLKITRTYKNVTYVLDPFEQENKIEIDNKKEIVKVIKKDINITNPLKKYKGIKLQKKEFEQIIKNYKEHFRELDDFLDFIVYIRFAEDRKKSFLNLNARSNWGKGFLMSVFVDDLECGIRVEATDLQEGRTGGLTEQHFINSLVIFIDEFKKFNNFLFKVTHNLALEPKFGFRSFVPVFGKILLNADKSESFSYLVDEQVANRVILLEVKNAKQLTENSLYNKNKVKYKYAVSKYIYNYLAEKIEMLKKMGKEQANIYADKQLQKIYNKYSIQNNYNIKDIIKQNLFAFLLKIYRNGEVELNLDESRIVKDIYIKDNNIYINKPVSTIYKILKNELEEQEYRKIEYKKGMILKILNKQQKTYRINRIPRLCILFKTEEIEEYLNENVSYECDNKFNNLQDFIYKVRRYVDIKDNEYKIEDNKLKIYSYIVTLQDLNEKLELYNCDLEKMLEEEAGEIKYELEQKINLEELDLTDAEEVEEDEIEKIFDEILNETESPF